MSRVPNPLQVPSDCSARARKLLVHYWEAVTDRSAWETRNNGHVPAPLAARENGALVALDAYISELEDLRERFIATRDPGAGQNVPRETRTAPTAGPLR